MKIYTFKGGIFPREMKELSKDYPIKEAFPSTKMVTIPVTMGGAPNEPVVKPGDSVAKGQIIAKSDAFMSAPVHASISGTVKKVVTRMVTGNTEVPCIVIQGDDSDRTDFMQPLDPFTCDKKEAIQRIRDAGIVGMGGASFPTHVKLNPPPDKKIEFVILNAAECEPYLTIDERTLQELPAKVIDGLSIVQKITGGHGMIALESNKAYIVETLTTEIKKAGSDIAVQVVKTKYPQGSEKNVITALTGREVPTRGLPADTGCIVINVSTVCAISDAFRLGKPLIDRGLTISGGAVEHPANLRIPIGTLVGDLIPEVITLKPGKTIKIISGGPMMGFAMTNADFPIAKGTSGILFLTKEEACLDEETQCIGCGKCFGACSMLLAPVMIARSLKKGNYEAAMKFGLMDCCECGSCAYICPAHVHLVQQFRLGKAVVRAQQRAAKAKAAAKETAGGKK
jgi:electron transport complex protein RnfC